MAMILEVLDGRGAVVTRVRVHSLPFTIGRAFDNDLILDDPYADAHHARVTVGGAGELVLEDLGSTNGIVHADVDLRAARIAAAAGRQVRVGSTLLRFRDTAEPVPPALLAGAARRVRGDRLTGSAARAAVSLLALLVTACFTWLGTYTRSPWSDALSMALAIAFLGGLWAGGWALAGRIAAQRFRFGAHFTIYSVALLLGLALGALSSWVNFLFPEHPLVPPLEVVVWFALTCLLLEVHLRHASRLATRRRWRGAFITTGVLYLLGGAIAFAAREPFTDVPTFSGITRPLAARWIPTSTIEDFVDGAGALQREVDELAAE